MSEWGRKDKANDKADDNGQWTNDNEEERGIDLIDLIDGIDGGISDLRFKI